MVKNGDEYTVAFSHWGVVHSNVDTATKVLSSLQAQFVKDKPPELQREVLKRKSEFCTDTAFGGFPIKHLVYKTSENFAESKVTSSNVLFCPTNGPETTEDLLN